jgi:hypothetical protein
MLATHRKLALLLKPAQVAQAKNKNCAGREENMQRDVLTISLNQLPASLQKQILAIARKNALTPEQRRVARAADALRRAGVNVELPEFPLPAAITIRF